MIHWQWLAQVDQLPCRTVSRGRQYVGEVILSTYPIASDKIQIQMLLHSNKHEENKNLQPWLHISSQVLPQGKCYKEVWEKVLSN